MKSPLASGAWVEVEETASTQDAMRDALAKNPAAAPGVLFARSQTGGRGRFDRPWFSVPGGSLAMSISFRDYADHPRPWLIGMATAVAAASVIHCRLRWPNDLFLDDKKAGGVLTEVFQGIPVVGVGINVNVVEFPTELTPHATSLALHRPSEYDVRTIAQDIVSRLDDLPEPDHWEPLQPIWSLFDDTPGKHYRLLSGEEALAIGIGPEGELVCSVDGETTMVMAAEAILG